MALAAAVDMESVATDIHHLSRRLGCFRRDCCRHEHESSERGLEGHADVRRATQIAVRLENQPGVTSQLLSMRAIEVVARVREVRPQRERLLPLLHRAINLTL